jgi:hypothetical protein
MPYTVWLLHCVLVWLNWTMAGPVPEAPTRVGSGEGNNRSKVLPRRNSAERRLRTQDLVTRRASTHQLHQACPSELNYVCWKCHTQSMDVNTELAFYGGCLQFFNSAKQIYWLRNSSASHVRSSSLMPATRSENTLVKISIHKCKAIIIRFDIFLPRVFTEFFERSKYMSPAIATNTMIILIRMEHFFIWHCLL